MNILGVKIDNLSRADILNQISFFLDEDKFHQIATINPEFLVEADRNTEFKRVLHNCALRVADGFGISLISFLRGEKLMYRFPGVDLMMEILKIADEKKRTLFLVVRADGLSSYDEVRAAIVKKYPNLKISGLNVSIAEYKMEDAEWKCLNENLKSAVVLCNFGSPAQEFFLENLKERGARSRVLVGVGGAFDYLTGKQCRAPKILRFLGFEWLWRLFLQPKRWRRIFRALFLFPMACFLEKK